MEIRDREMILYQERELIELLNHVEQFNYHETSIQCVAFHVHSNKRYMMKDPFLKMLHYPIKRNIKNLDLGGMQYVCPKDHAYKNDVKETYDVIFRLEFNRVPMIINSFPEIAKWRLSIGK